MQSEPLPVGRIGEAKERSRSRKEKKRRHGDRDRSGSRKKRRHGDRDRKDRRRDDDSHHHAAAPQHPGPQPGQPFYPHFGGYGPPGVSPWGSQYSAGPVYGHPPAAQTHDESVDVKVSSKFLMRNDYSQTFVDTGLRPQNYIRDLDYANRYSEYPKIERLIKLKDEILAKRATPGMSLKCDLKEFDFNSLGTKFDVVLIDPPWEEYQTRVAGMYVPDEDKAVWNMEELRQLKVNEVADSQSFIFLWCGETHLEHGRELIKRWGFRRVEDICWVKTNRLAATDHKGRVKRQTVMYGDQSILQRTKEHCIVGVKGTLKRSVDTHFLHANCDVDLIMEEEKGFGSTQKPSEMYEIIEHFCLGRRRLELFGNDRNLRDGWLTLGSGLTTSNWNKEAYLSWFEGDGRWPEVKDYKGGKLLGSISEIEALRPKSPVRPGRKRSESPRRMIRGGSSAGGWRAARASREYEEDERPLPEDMGELAPALPKEDE
eukprot:TRINITY_DN14474_c0_g1_i1.p1 TRINITY_DN14474_c0_g1~~TRINITY_DN14474_c0_g1_i1.p1  ORF type:complete len:485 (+),score=73.96 TRINITY_DN14474_c0_g1_i1:85-1539(+)